MTITSSSPNAMKTFNNFPPKDSHAFEINAVRSTGFSTMAWIDAWV